jgi:hypothetical protein
VVLSYGLLKQVGHILIAGVCNTTSCNRTYGSLTSQRNLLLTSSLSWWATAHYRARKGHINPIRTHTIYLQVQFYPSFKTLAFRLGSSFLVLGRISVCRISYACSSWEANSCSTRHLTEPESSLLYLQEAATGPYPMESSPYHPQFEIHFNIILTLRLNFSGSFNLSVLTTITRNHLSVLTTITCNHLPPCMLHVLAISFPLNTRISDYYYSQCI